MKDRINYQESCFIINAMNSHIGEYMKYLKEKYNKSKEEIEESVKYWNEILYKYIKLEGKILDLRIDKEETKRV